MVASIFASENYRLKIPDGIPTHELASKAGPAMRRLSGRPSSSQRLNLSGAPERAFASVSGWPCDIEPTK